MRTERQTMFPMKYDKHYYKCPACGEDLGVDDDDLYIYDVQPPRFCSRCGQELTWKNENQHHNSNEKAKLIEFRTKNVDGEEKVWCFQSEEELLAMWHTDDALTLPGNDDPVIDHTAFFGKDTIKAVQFEDIIREAEERYWKNIKTMSLKEQHSKEFDVEAVIRIIQAEAKKMAEAKLPHRYYKAIGTRKVAEILRRESK